MALLCSLLLAYVEFYKKCAQCACMLYFLAHSFKIVLLMKLKMRHILQLLRISIFWHDWLFRCSCACACACCSQLLIILREVRTSCLYSALFSLQRKNYSFNENKSTTHLVALEHCYLLVSLSAMLISHFLALLAPHPAFHVENSLQHFCCFAI